MERVCFLLRVEPEQLDEYITRLSRNVLRPGFMIAATDKQVTGRLTQSGQCSPFNSSNQRL